MVKIIDDVIIRLSFIVLLGLIIYLYRFVHQFFSPKQASQKKGVYLIKDNAAQVLHYFSRLVGICIIFQSIGFSFSNDILMNIIHFIFWSLSATFTYLLNIFIMESAILYEFDYGDEVIKKQNMPYSFICSFFSIASAFVFTKIIETSGYSLRNFLILWLTSMSLITLVLKLYPFLSRMNFSLLLSQKREAIVYSYLGFACATIILIMTATTSWIAPKLIFYFKVVSAKALFLAILFPLINRFIRKLFKKVAFQTHTEKENRFKYSAYGIFEGASFLSTGLLISMLVDKVFLYQF